jgi:radical SAM enzyme (TIGR01210 family)
VNDLTRQILNARGPRNSVDPWRPWAFFVEQEYSRHGRVEDVATLFLTNRECPFHCLMCDLWKNTTEEIVPVGAIPAQIEWALQHLPAAPHIKLYNSGNFFDPKAIPRGDWPAIARLVAGFETVIVENHPKLVSDSCREFQQLCDTRLEVALGLETSHAETLAALNKQMTVKDFEEACRLLMTDQIDIRAFILFKPPWTTEQQAIIRSLESIRFAFECGVSCCSIIPVRTGNGMMERLQQEGTWKPPLLSSLEHVMQTALGWNRGRVFIDLWEARQFADTPDSAYEQLERLNRMNLRQRSD